jgi:hypothetical protein
MCYNCHGIWKISSGVFLFATANWHDIAAAITESSLEEAWPPFWSSTEHYNCKDYLNLCIMWPLECASGDEDRKLAVVNIKSYIGSDPRLLISWSLSSSYSTEFTRTGCARTGCEKWSRKRSVACLCTYVTTIKKPNRHNIIWEHTSVMTVFETWSNGPVKPSLTMK